MLKIKIKKEIKDYCTDLLKKYNFGQRGFADGNYHEQLVGLIGQCSILDLFGQPLISGENGFDEGVDMFFSGYTIDIKTMGRTTEVRDYYVNNFIALQKDYKTQIYIFCSFNKNNDILTICGWVTKKQLLDKAKFYKMGTKRFRSDGTYFKTKADLYEINNCDLNEVISIEKLKQDLIEGVKLK